MRYRRAVLIYNPAAGRRRARRAVEIHEALELLRRHIDVVEAWPTEAAGAAAELARCAGRQGFDLVLACGGDGTINEVVNGLALGPVALGVLPAGTANVLALDLGLPLSVKETAARLPNFQSHRIALGRLAAPETSRYFLSMCGAGLDAHIVYRLNERLKSRFGVLAYWWAGLGELLRRPEVLQVTVDGHRYDCTFALAARAHHYGGRLQIARGADLLANDLHIALFRSAWAVRYLVYLGAVLSGAQTRLSDVTFLKARRMELTAPGATRIHLQVDGEHAGHLPAVIELVPDALTLLMPPDYAKRRPADG